MFGRSWTIFHVRGIPIRLHISLLLFLPYVAFAAGAQYRALAHSMGLDPSESALPPSVWGLLLAVALLAAITLHELAHSLVAMQSGVRVRSITLMMLGGVSAIERDVSPSREAWMAFAGPLTSFVTALVSYAMYKLVRGSPDVSIALLWFAMTNAIVGAFNMLPAFPMDGGRVLRGLLASRLGVARATRIATRTGQTLAIAFAVWGFLNFNVFLMLIAAFIYMGASAERARLDTRDLLHGVPVSQLMNDRIGDADESESAAEVASRLLTHNLVGARVSSVANPTVPGIVTVWDLAGGRDVENPSVADKVRADLPRVRSDEDASRALDLFLNEHASTLVVVDRDQRIVGVVTEPELKRALALANAMGVTRRKPSAR